MVGDLETLGGNENLSSLRTDCLKFCDVLGCFATVSTTRQMESLMNKPMVFAFAILVAIAGIAPDVLATERACRPSLSNLWKCPDTSVSTKRTASKADRACRPRLSNGY